MTQCVMPKEELSYFDMTGGKDYKEMVAKGRRVSLHTQIMRSRSDSAYEPPTGGESSNPDWRYDANYDGAGRPIRSRPYGNSGRFASGDPPGSSFLGASPPKNGGQGRTNLTGSDLDGEAARRVSRRDATNQSNHAVVRFT